LRELEGALPERISVLGEIPDVPPEHDLRLHLGSDRCPCGNHLHEFDFDETECADSFGAVVDCHAHAWTISSTILAVSSGCADDRSDILTEDTRRTISIIRRAGGTFNIETGVGCSSGKCSSDGRSATRRGFASKGFRNTTTSSVAARGGSCGTSVSTGRRSESCHP